jgi:STE24 endopeptidase
MSYIDRKVTAIPAERLLSADPNALIDRERASIARTYGLYRRPLFVFWALSAIVAYFYLWNSGNAARLRDWLRRRFRTPFALRFVFGAALAVYGALAALPASLAQYRVAYVFDQLSEPFGLWLRDGVARLALDAIAVGLVVACVLSLVDVTRQWWIYSMLGLFVASIAFSVIEPLGVGALYGSNQLRPFASMAPVIAQSLAEPARKLGIPNAKVFVVNASRRTAVADASVVGFGPSARVVVTDTMLAGATPGEIRYAVVRELVKLSRFAGLRKALLGTLLFIACIALGVLVSDRIGFRRDDDPLARLALVFALACTAALILYPVYNGYSRRVERQADAAALALTADPASAIRHDVRFSEERFLPVCPRAITRFYFYDFDPLGTRAAAVTGRPDPCP